jgi:hypothetical protein
VGRSGRVAAFTAQRSFAGQHLRLLVQDGVVSSACVVLVVEAIAVIALRDNASEFLFALVAERLYGARLFDLLKSMPRGDSETHLTSLSDAMW